MNLLVVPKPLFNSDMTVEGYYFSYQYGNAILEAAKSNPLDGAMHSPFITLLNDVGLEALTQNKRICVPITQILLMTDLDRECKTPPDKVVFLLEKNTEINDTTLERIRRFFSLGYKFALYMPDFPALVAACLPYTDYVLTKLPPNPSPNELRGWAREYSPAKLIAIDISNKPFFDQIKHSGIGLFDGPFYKVHIPIAARQNALTPLKVNYVQLLNIVNQNDFDFQSFTRVIRQDTALAIQFMRLVNSSSRMNAEIKNINQAAAMLGQREIKKWVATAVSTALSTDRPSEITRLSLIRAKFCENMAKHFELAVVQDNLFLTGLLSVLDVILEMPMEEALKMVFVPDLIRRALSGGKGDYSRVLNFVLEYEHGNWHEISRQALMMNLSISDIHDAYINAMLWYGELINTPLQENIMA